MLTGPASLSGCARVYPQDSPSPAAHLLTWLWSCGLRGRERAATFNLDSGLLDFLICGLFSQVSTRWKWCCLVSFVFFVSKLLAGESVSASENQHTFAAFLWLGSQGQSYTCVGRSALTEWSFSRAHVSFLAACYWLSTAAKVCRDHDHRILTADLSKGHTASTPGTCTGRSSAAAGIFRCACVCVRADSVKVKRGWESFRAKVQFIVVLHLESGTYRVHDVREVPVFESYVRWQPNSH